MKTLTRQPVKRISQARRCAESRRATVGSRNRRCQPALRSLAGWRHGACLCRARH